MTIGFDASDLCTGRADGTTRYTFELAKRLPGLGSEHEWLFFGPCDSLPSLRSVSWLSSPWPRYWTQSRFPLELYRFRPDVLFMPIQQLPYMRPGKMKTVAVIHDLAFHIYPEHFTYKDWLLQHVFTAYAARRADQVICVSQSTADDVAGFYGRTENITVVHHGVDLQKFSPPQARGRYSGGDNHPTSILPSLEGRKFLLFVGQIQPRKNIVRLVEAFEQLAERDRELELVIAGGHGWLQEAILRRIQTSKFASRIIQKGAVSQGELVELYQQAEAFVLPSLYEGFGMPILEAMACACPVVTSNVSSMPEVAGGAAVLVDPMSVDSIAAGIEEARRRGPELRETGIARAREFSWERCARETLTVLQTGVG